MIVFPIVLPTVIKMFTLDNRYKRLQAFLLPIVANKQFVKRLVQTVALLRDVATDPQIRDGYVKATLARQKMLPKRETKEDFLRLADGILFSYMLIVNCYFVFDKFMLLVG